MGTMCGYSLPNKESLRRDFEKLSDQEIEAKIERKRKIAFGPPRQVHPIIEGCLAWIDIQILEAIRKERSNGYL